MKKILTIIFAVAAVSVSAQCFPDRHNTSWNEGWFSCTPNDNPNTERGLSHWVMYDFGNTYRLGEVYMWNLNDNKRLGNGFKDFLIDYSVDGKIWKNLGIFDIDKAPGTSTYEGEVVATLEGDTARYVILTAVSNWGGQCVGFAEVQFEVLEVTSQMTSQFANDCFSTSIFPNPHIEAFNFVVTTKCAGPMDFAMYDHTGKLIKKGTLAEGQSIHQETVQTSSLAPGLYHLVVHQEGMLSRHPVVKMLR
jgi:hypothetical protein